MGKYLELFRGEVGDLTEKTKIENKPYVAYSTKEGKVVYTVVPEPVRVQQANELWYTTVDGQVAEVSLRVDPGRDSIISNTYENGQGVISYYYNPDHFWGTEYYNSEISYFEQPERIESVCFPIETNNISNYCFFNASNLKSISFAGTKEQWLKNKEYGGGINDSIYNLNTENITVLHCIDGDIPIHEA